MSFAELRREYTRHGLLEADTHPDPFEQFRRWFDQALSAGVPDANAMTLATTKPDGRPAARIVLLKGFGAEGFVFFTNHESRKGRELALNPYGALVFYWPELERQVRVEGGVARTSVDESDRYFRTRPRGSRLGAWASPQSEVIGGREEIERRAAEVAARFPGDEVPRPSNWGGYRLAPVVFEFWQGRPNRLHDRLEYVRAGAAWCIRRLAP
jgi:pyridoxamine 5'-phosphate oxidase